MSNLYVVDLALNLRASVPSAVVADLRWHLGIKIDENGEDRSSETGDRFPLLAARGAAVRIGGVLVDELVQAAAGRVLTVRQEAHAEVMPELESLAERRVWHASTQGVFGQIRFYKDDVPELLINTVWDTGEAAAGSGGNRVRLMGEGFSILDREIPCPNPA
ncbi:hypothetical protein ACFYWY_19880 [Streptomyces sp. NPDC002870]|uniref:hypothetical protein n=1 Tax=Streptomyces sp. NPDC002870 TaxID=3364666 RepID=UPI0036CD22D3